MYFNALFPTSVLFIVLPLAQLHAAEAEVAAAAGDSAIAVDVTAVMAERGIPGAQVAIVMPDGAIRERSFGVRDLASSAPMTADTLIQVGSVTKIFTVSLVADLVADGSLGWSDALAERLPGVTIRADFADITLDELATHTARLPPNPPNRVDAGGVMQPYSTAALYASLSNADVRRPAPGRTYSNWGYALLGHIAEKATGKRFEAVLHERMFKPLGMSNSKIALSPADEARLAVHYWPEDEPRVPRPRWHFGEIAGFGGITSTAGDLAKFLRYQIRPDSRTDVLDAAGIQSLRAVRTLGSSWQAGGGRGWLIVRDPDGTITLEHSGEVDGHSSYIGFSPDTHVGVAVTANLGGSSAREIALPLLARMVAQARQLQPTNREVAMTLVRNRQWADAEAALLKVITAVPGDEEAWGQLGVARYELRDLPGAEAALLQAVKNGASAGSPMFMLAVIAAVQGRIDTAFERLQRALQDTGAKFDLDRTELRVLQSDARWARLVATTQRDHPRP